MQKSKQQNDTNALGNITEELAKHQLVVGQIFKHAEKIRENVTAIRTQMDDCQIPANIKKRQQEIELFQDKLMAVNDSFAIL